MRSITLLSIDHNAVMARMSTHEHRIRRRRPADVRRRLLEEAARILGEEGPSALSARRLATAAGTSTMAVYTHFGGDAGGGRRGRRPRASAGSIEHVDAVGTTEDPLADLRRMAGAYRDNALENRHLYGVMFGAISVGGFHGRGPDREVRRRPSTRSSSGIAAGDGRRRAA